MRTNIDRYGMILNTERFEECVAFYRELFGLCQIFPNLLKAHLFRACLVVEQNILPDIRDVCTPCLVTHVLQSNKISHLIEKFRSIRHNFA